MSISDAGALLAMGIRNNFADTWQPMYDGWQAQMGGMIDLVTSDKIEEKYASPESAPHPRRLDRGDDRRVKGYDSVQWTVENLDWDNNVGWHANDAADDQTGGSLLRRARQAGENFALLHERIIFQILNATADPELLANQPQTPNGNAIFANNHKFGSNVTATASGVGTAENVRTDMFAVLALMRAAKDTEGQPLLPNSLSGQSITVMFGSGNEQVFRKAFEQGRTLEEASGGATTNVIMDAGLAVRLIPTPRIADNDWYVNFDGVQTKPFIIQERQGLREITSLMSNDAHAKRTKEEGVFWDARYGYGLNEPYGIYKVDNS